MRLSDWARATCSNSGHLTHSTKKLSLKNSCSRGAKTSAREKRHPVWFVLCVCLRVGQKEWVCYKTVPKTKRAREGRSCVGKHNSPTCLLELHLPVVQVECLAVKRKEGRGGGEREQKEGKGAKKPESQSTVTNTDRDSFIILMKTCSNTSSLIPEWVEVFHQGEQVVGSKPGLAQFFSGWCL